MAWPWRLPRVGMLDYLPLSPPHRFALLRRPIAGSLVLSTASQRTLRRRAQRQHTLRCLKAVLSVSKAASKQPQPRCPIEADDLESFRASLFINGTASISESATQAGSSIYGFNGSDSGKQVAKEFPWESHNVSLSGAHHHHTTNDPLEQAVGVRLLQLTAVCVCQTLSSLCLFAPRRYY